MAKKRTRCENSGCHERASVFMSGKFYCDNCKPVKIERTAAEEVDIMGDISIRDITSTSLEIKNIGPGCTCKPKKWWEKFLEHFKSNTPPGCG